MEGMRGLRFLVLLALLLAASTAAGDPAVTQPSPTEGLAQWTFSNPANYTLANVVLGPGGASLAWSSGSLIDSSAADFGSAGTQSNLDLTTQPGDVLIADTSAFMAAAVLYLLTVGPVRGFAFFLGLSTILDVVVAYFFKRPLVVLLGRWGWLQRSKFVGMHTQIVQETIRPGLRGNES